MPKNPEFEPKIEKTERNYETPPELIKRIEGSKLTLDDKIYLLLTKAGLKPASEIILEIKSDYEGEITEHISEKEVQEVIKLIEESGLPSQIGKREIVKESYRTKKKPKVEKFFEREQMKILIGRSEEDLNTLLQALETKSAELLGKAYDYPKTAIEAFVGKREKLDLKTLPKEVRESDAILFSSPMLSKDNWQEEIKQGEIYADFIKKISPTIYEERKARMLRREDISLKENK